MAEKTDRNTYLRGVVITPQKNVYRVLTRDDLEAAVTCGPDHRILAVDTAGLGYRDLEDLIDSVNVVSLVGDVVSYGQGYLEVLYTADVNRFLSHSWLDQPYREWPSSIYLVLLGHLVD